MGYIVQDAETSSAGQVFIISEYFTISFQEIVFEKIIVLLYNLFVKSFHKYVK